MDKEQYKHLCIQAEEGREDIFVNNPSAREGGMVVECGTDHLIVETSEGKRRTWSYQECEETLSRREIFPYR